MNKRRINWDLTPYQDPFYDPVPVPTPNPADAPTRCFQVNHEYIPYLVGALNRLTREDAWRGDAAAQRNGVQKAHTLIATLLEQNCPEGLPDGLCTDFLPENPFIRYFPNNPFTTPDYIPPGYNRPPFYTNVTNPILGIIPQDVMTDLLVLNPGVTLPELIGFSFPTIHIELSGTGQCELEFVKILQGGFCTVTVDSNPFQARLVDLNAVSITDFVSILAVLGIVFSGVLVQTHILEIEFETPGDHTIDIKFYPNVGGSEIIGFGGGLRRISFCDQSLDGDMNYMPITDIRVNQASCKWEVEYNDDGIWVEIGDYYVPACEPPIPPQTLIRDPGDGHLEQSLDGGATYSDIPNAKFLHIAGDNDPLLNTLDIDPPTGNQGIRIRYPTAPSVNPLEFLINSARRAYINQSGAFVSTQGVTVNQTQLISSGDPAVLFTRDGQTNTIWLQQTLSAPDEALDFKFNTLTRHRFYKDRAKIYRGVYLQDATTVTTRDTALLRSVWADNVDANRRSQVILECFHAAEAREIMRGEASTTAPKIGVLGADPVARIPITGDCQGNQVVKDIAALLATFGWATDTTTLGDPPVPTPGACELDKCGYAEVTGAWFATQVFGVAAYWAGRYDEIMFQSERFDKIIANTDVHFANQDTLGDWVNEIYVAYGIFDASDDDLNLFLEEAQTYIKADVVPQIACFMSDCGYMTSTNWDIFISQLDDTAGVNHWVRDLFRCLDHYGLAAITALGSQSAYREGLTLDCETLDCDNWTVTMDFTDDDWADSVNIVEGEYDSVYRSISGTSGNAIIIQIPFASVAASITVYNQFSTPNDSLFVREIGGTQYTFYSPELGQSVHLWSGDAPAGLEIGFANSGAGTDRDSEIRAITLSGTGTAPEPDA